MTKKQFIYSVFRACHSTVWGLSRKNILQHISCRIPIGIGIPIPVGFDFDSDSDEDSDTDRNSDI